VVGFANRKHLERVEGRDDYRFEAAREGVVAHEE
jgi:hypothetical protein